MGRSLMFVLVLASASCTRGDDGGAATGTTSGTSTGSDMASGTESASTGGGTDTGTSTGVETGTDGGGCPEGALGDDDNCGACGVACTVHDLYAFGEFGGCEDGACKPTWSSCFEESDGYADCAAACAAIGETCVAQGCGDGAGFTATAYATPEACEGFESPQDAWWGNIACDEAPMLGGGAGRCCCTDTP